MKIKRTTITSPKKRLAVPSKSNVPKYMWGSLISSAASIGMGLINAKKQKKAQIEAANTSMANALTAQEANDIVALENYEEEGVGNVNYYNAKGGKLAKPSYMTEGGKLVPLSSDMEEAKGNKHGETTIDNTSGIKLKDNNNQAIAEIEDGETIKDGRKVYSDRLTADGKRTYADVATDLATQKGNLEKELTTADPIKKNTIKRQMQIIDSKEDKLFAEQEASKENTPMENTNIPKAEDGIDLDEPKKINWKKVGTDLASFGNKVLPFVDNITNAILTKNTPKINKPQLATPAKLETEVNVNPQLAAVRDVVDATSKSIEDNTSSSATARANIGATKLAGAKQTANILTQKENTERQLRNTDAMNRQQVQASNLAKLDTFEDKKLARLDDIQGRISANVANVVGDVIEKRNFDAEQAYQNERLDIARQTYGVKGTTNRAILDSAVDRDKIATDPEYAKQLYPRFKGTPEEEQFLRIVNSSNRADVSKIITPNYAKI